MAIVDFEQLSQEANQLNFGRAILTVIAFVFYALGWSVGIFFFGLGWAFVAMRAGWRQGRAGGRFGAARTHS